MNAQRGEPGLVPGKRREEIFLGRGLDARVQRSSIEEM